MNSPPRICCPTWRAFKKVAFQSAIYEAQDVLAEIDHVDFLSPEPGIAFEIREALQRRLIWRDVTKTLAHRNPGLKPVPLQRDYDVFIAVCQSWWDILYLNSIKGWRDRCGTSICWFDELWAAWLPDYKNWLHVLDEFDHVAVAFAGSVEPLSKALGRDCHWVPSGIDTRRFSPAPYMPPRTVDVYSIGRRYPGVHEALLKMTDDGKLLYIHDTFTGSMAQVPDHRQHRNLLANIAKRSRYFMVGPAKMGVHEDTKGQAELGYRYFEGAAAGTVMIGQAPVCQAFNDCFDWPDAVIHVKPDGSDVREVLSDLDSEPERQDAIRRRNARESLLRHDWVYRWKRLLSIAGLKSMPGMEVREAALSRLAEAVELEPAERPAV